jgi:hypothetical protein
MTRQRRRLPGRPPPARRAPNLTQLMPSLGRRRPQRRLRRQVHHAPNLGDRQTAHRRHRQTRQATIQLRHLPRSIASTPIRPQGPSQTLAFVDGMRLRALQASIVRRPELDGRQ